MVTCQLSMVERMADVDAVLFVSPSLLAATLLAHPSDLFPLGMEYWTNSLLCSPETMRESAL